MIRQPRTAFAAWSGSTTERSGFFGTEGCSGLAGVVRRLGEPTDHDRGPPASRQPAPLLLMTAPARSTRRVLARRGTPTPLDAPWVLPAMARSRCSDRTGRGGQDPRHGRCDAAHLSTLRGSVATAGELGYTNIRMDGRYGSNGPTVCGARRGRLATVALDLGGGPFPSGPRYAVWTILRPTRHPGSLRCLRLRASNQGARARSGAVGNATPRSAPATMTCCLAG